MKCARQIRQSKEKIKTIQMLVIFLLLQIGISIFLSAHFIVAVLSYSTICKWICKLVFWDLVSLVTVNIMIAIQIYIHAILWE